MALSIRPVASTKGKLLSTLFIAFALVAQPAYGFVAGQVANALAGEVVNITDAAELRNAIENQEDGQTWNIAAGDYGLNAEFSAEVPGSSPAKTEDKLFFPITADNISIVGSGNPVIYGAEYTSNGSGGLQGSFINVLGDNVSISGVTVMTKAFGNKAIEVRGDNSSINNVLVTSNTKVDQSVFDSTGYPDYSKYWAGSIYYHETSGNHTLNNVTVRNGGISHQSPLATLALTNTSIVYDAPCIPTTWCDAIIYSYRLRDNGNTVIGEPQVTYRASDSATNIKNILTNYRPGDVIELDSNLTTTDQITLNKPVTLNGNGHTIFNSRDNGAKDNGNNSVIGIQSDNVTINDLTIDGAGGVWMHGINTYEAKGVNVNNVTLKNNSNAGMIVGKDSDVTVNNITTAGNGWYGINVDKKSGTSAKLTVKGVSTHNEDETAHVYIDSRDVAGNTVSDPGLQYVRYWKGAGYQYLLDREKPAVALSVDAFNPSSFDVVATDDRDVNRIDYSIWKDGSRIGIWGNSISYENPYNRTVTQYCERVGATPGNAGTCEFHPFSDLSDGEYTLHATVQDVRGKSTNSTPVTFKVDHTPPTASLVASSSSPTTGDEITITGSVEDDDIKSHWFEITTPSGIYYVTNMNTTSKAHSFVLDTSAGAGEYRVRYVATDRASNRNDSVEPAILVVSVTEPQSGGDNSGDQNENVNTGTGGESLTEEDEEEEETLAQIFTSPAFFGFGTPSLEDEVTDIVDTDDGASGDSAVLGERDEVRGTPLADTGEVLGIMEHKVFGIAWYWYLVIFATVVGAWLLLAGATRRSNNEA